MSRLSLSFALSALAMGCSEYGLGGPRHVDPVATASEAPSEPVEAPVEPPDVPGEPVADAGPDFTAEPLAVVTLDGTSSYDPGGQRIVAVRWELVAAPGGSSTFLADPGAPRPELFLDVAGDYVLSLTVKNEDGVWDSTPDEAVITAMPLDGFYVQLSWDAGNDLDLHLLDGSSGLFGRGDCSYCNMTPHWGQPGRSDDPSLDIDAINGFGPETITIDDPADGTFHVAVHYYGENGVDQCRGACAVSEATVQVYLDGQPAATFVRTLDDQGQLWDVADIDWPSGTIHDIDRLGRTQQSACAF